MIGVKRQQRIWPRQKVSGVRGGRGAAQAGDGWVACRWYSQTKQARRTQGTGSLQHLPRQAAQQRRAAASSVVGTRERTRQQYESRPTSATDEARTTTLARATRGPMGELRDTGVLAHTRRPELRRCAICLDVKGVNSYPRSVLLWQASVPKCNRDERCARSAGRSKLLDIALSDISDRASSLAWSRRCCRAAAWGALQAPPAWRRTTPSGDALHMCTSGCVMRDPARQGVRR